MVCYHIQNMKTVGHKLVNRIPTNYTFLNSDMNSWLVLSFLWNRRLTFSRDKLWV